VPCGLSDHSLGIEVPVAAVALGACVIEKHFIKSRSEGGPDSAFSLEISELKTMVKAVRNTEKALGRVQFQVTEKEKAGQIFRKSIFVSKDIAEGERFTEENIRCVRPGYGIHTRHYATVLNKVSSADLKAGTPLSFNYIK